MSESLDEAKQVRKAKHYQARLEALQQKAIAEGCPFIACVAVPISATNYRMVTVFSPGARGEVPAPIVAAYVALGGAPDSPPPG